MAWPHEQTIFPNLKRRLGLVFCFARNCHLVACGSCAIADMLKAALKPSDAGTAAQKAGNESQTEQTLTQLVCEPPLMSCMEPRVSPDGQYLVFLSHDQV